MIGASALNVSAPAVDNILGFLAVLEAAKDPKAVKEFLAELQGHREQIANAERGLQGAAQHAQKMKDEAKAAAEDAVREQAAAVSAKETAIQAQQVLSETRAHFERREQELKDGAEASRQELRLADANAQRALRDLEIREKALAVGIDQLAAEQAALDIATAEVESLRATLASRLDALRAIASGTEGSAQ